MTGAVVVTGAGGGIGRAVATALAPHTGLVALWDRDRRALETTAQQVAAAGGEALLQRGEGLRGRRHQPAEAFFD